MDLQYLLSKKTGGANPFKIWDVLEHRVNVESLAFGLKRMPYRFFLETAYWFSVSMVAKSRAGMRCQVCNSPDSIQVHHRTYDNHGYEHRNMSDLVVLCDNCHGLFHGNMPEYKRPHLAPVTTVKIKLPKRFVVPHTEDDIQVPDGEVVTLTKELIDRCRANGSFTNATLRAFGMTKETMQKGWTARLEGRQMTRAEFKQALEGRFMYHTGPLKKPLQQTIAEKRWQMTTQPAAI